MAVACVLSVGTARAGGLYVSEFATPDMGTALAGAQARAGDAATALTRQVGLSFQWANLGHAQLDNEFVKGSYEVNDAFFFNFNLNWKKLPWSGRATF